VTRQTNKQNSLLLSNDGEWLTVRPVVVSRYTQTRQMWLRAKIVKSGHGKYYKGALAVYRKKGGNNTTTTVSITVFKSFKTRK